MNDRIREVFDSITTRDVMKETSFGSPRLLTDSAKHKMDDLLQLGPEAVPVAEHARFLYQEMLKTSEIEKKSRNIPAKRPPGLISTIFSGKSVAALPSRKPNVSSWDRRAQLKASIYLMGRFCETQNTRRPEFIDLLLEFSQTRHFDVFDDSRAILKRLGITEESIWEIALRSLPILPEQPYETVLGMPGVIRTLKNTAGFQIVSRCVSGDHFSFGSTYTHEHSIHRIAENAWVLRVRRFN
jgi:hypothetical protein